ncbi:MAG: type II toxin-antitoxin system Phd/YefM family antitoxin [Candidatus Eremiobacteraeota bacterium]|nr:type II toxin-antitoxin system Phd/YefM family antitoxin [Candidatus Eremiobacteraeota bacterium]
MHSAKTNLSRLVEEIRSGAETEIIIAKGDKPAARLVPYKKTDRLFGFDKGLFEIPADFDEPCPEIEAMFYGTSD